MAFTCPRCGRTSDHPTDEAEGYCGACNDWMPRILGVNTRTYPKQGAEYPEHGGWNREGCTVRVVLVAGDPRVGDYAAYAGAGSPEWVARYGDKLCFAEACVHFPGQLEEDHYREH
jgi:hypothetical protein